MPIRKNLQKGVASHLGSLVFIIMVAAVFGTYVSLTVTSSCSSNGPCTLYLNGGKYNSIVIQLTKVEGGENIVPVLLMRANSTSSIYVLYLTSPYSSRITTENLPSVFTPPVGGQLSNSIRFSNANLLLQNASMVLYEYTVTALSNSTGYYQMYFWDSCGLGLPFVIGVSADDLNMSELHIFGYSGVFYCQISPIRSELVGISSNITEVTINVPSFTACYNVDCTEYS